MEPAPSKRLAWPVELTPATFSATNSPMLARFAPEAVRQRYGLGEKKDAPGSAASSIGHRGPQGHEHNFPSERSRQARPPSSRVEDA